MQTFISHSALLVSLLILIAIAFQDFKTCEVSLYLYIAGFLLFSVFEIMSNGLSLYFQNLVFNIVFIAFLLSVVWLWFTIKNRKAVKLADNYLGWGDILFFVTVAPVFSISQYVLFLTSSFAVALIYSLSIYFRKKEFNKIPLAGIMSVGFLFFSVWNYIYNFNFLLKNFLN